MEHNIFFQVLGSETQLPVTGNQDKTKDWGQNPRNTQIFSC